MQFQSEIYLLHVADFLPSIRNPTVLLKSSSKVMTATGNSSFCWEKSQESGCYLCTCPYPDVLVPEEGWHLDLFAEKFQLELPSCGLVLFPYQLLLGVLSSFTVCFLLDASKAGFGIFPRNSRQHLQVEKAQMLLNETHIVPFHPSALPQQSFLPNRSTQHRWTQFLILGLFQN